MLMSEPQVNLIETWGLISIGEAVTQIGVEGKMGIHSKTVGVYLGEATCALFGEAVGAPFDQANQAVSAESEATQLVRVEGEVHAPVASPGTRRGQMGVRAVSSGQGCKRMTSDTDLSMLGDPSIAAEVGHRARKPGYGVMEQSTTEDTSVSNDTDSGQMSDDMVRSGETPWN
ncbi:unnamed protein product [Ilex paraguariensis]|uniref:Uncharacterized protein n=1 Tax=Ilex paraguariensis TaxID=185542 RepID=A0ABC8S904_9AQUA